MVLLCSKASINPIFLTSFVIEIQGIEQICSHIKCFAGV